MTASQHPRSLAAGTFRPIAATQPPVSGSGAKRFDDLRELNNKLSRAIAKLEAAPRGGFDEPQLRRAIKDLEVTKLRAVNQFPPVFGLPYAETFTKLSCIDEEFSQARLVLEMFKRGLVGGHFPGIVAHTLLIDVLKGAKACKDALEMELGTGSGVPSGVMEDLRELNNKLAREISNLEEAPRGRIDEGGLRRTLKDLEVTKLRAVGGFPEVLDPPYIDTFTKLSCIDEEFSQARLVLEMFKRGLVGGHFPGIVAHTLLIDVLKGAKACKDTLEVELMHSFDLKPNEQTEVGVNATTPNGADVQTASKLNAPKPLQRAYTRDGFVGRHERDYVANGVNGSNPESWPQGRNVLFFDVFDLFGSTRGAQKAEVASEQNLKASGFVHIPDSSLGSGEAVFQKSTPPLLSTIIYVQRGTFIMKIAGACKGCAQGSIEGSLEQFAQTLHGQAVANGFPPGRNAPSGSHGCSGSAPVNQNQIKAQFTCAKDFKQLQMIMPSGYTIASGNVSNSAIGNAFNCLEPSDNRSVTCIGNVPKGSTTTVQFTTSPSATVGMLLQFNVTFSDGSTTSFTETTR